MNSKIISLFSNKGGSGKTFLAVNIATALAQKGKKVVLLDLDFEASFDSTRMLSAEAAKSVFEIIPLLKNIAENKNIDDYIKKLDSGLYYIPTIKEISQAPHVTSEVITKVVNILSESYKYVVIDTGKVLNATSLACLNLSGLILFVVTPDILSVAQAKWSFRTLQGFGFPLSIIQVVLNRSGSKGGVSWQEVKLSLNKAILSRIPSEGQTVGLALNRGIPVVVDSPKSKISKALEELSGQLVDRKDIYIEHKSIENIL